MKAGNKLLELHKLVEGMSQKAYRCPAGVLTIGIGHANQETEPFTEDDVWSEEKIIEVWHKDIAKAESLVNEWLEDTVVTQGWFDALTDLVFNTGRKPKTLLRYLEYGAEELAEEEFLRWIYAGGVVQLGLIKRRLADMEISRGGDPDVIIGTPLNRNNLSDFNRLFAQYGYKIVPTDGKEKYAIEEI